MITEDYVSFETAKLLKEKGFDEPCSNRYYETHSGFDLGLDPGYTNSHWEDLYKNMGVRNYSAPTIQMTMKWLREIHHCVICITPLTFYCGENVNSWGYNIWAGDNLEVDEENTPKFTTYEEACEAAIKYCLESLI